MFSDVKSEMNTRFRKLLLKVCRYIPALTDLRLLVQTKVTYDSLAGRPTDVRQYEHFRFYMVKYSNRTRPCVYKFTNLFTADHSDCIPGFRIEKYVIPRSRFGIRLTDQSLFWYLQLTYFMHRAPTNGISEL